MQPTVLTWNVGTVNSIAKAQAVAAAQPLQLLTDPTVSLNGVSYVTVNPGFTRTVSVTSTTTNLSGGTVTINGVDANNNAITQTITGPAATATVYTTTLFKAVTSVTSSLAAVDISVGTMINPTPGAGVGQSNYLLLDYNLPSYSASVAVNVLTTVFNYSCLKSLDKPYLINQNQGTVIVNPNIQSYPITAMTTVAVDAMAALTADNTATLALNSPVTMVWMTVNPATTSAGSATFTLLQQGEAIR